MATVSATVEINSSSKESIFSGNLLKAPPLNRRGRKKWHERYIVLRANRTLETFKTRKAAMSHKSPRRVIDLRSCINLEIGLEYKNQQHILSIGTFKRTFFFAAPSDPLMLQWSYLLEKTKNAQEGETIEVLDIGLRKSRDKPAVHRVKPHSRNSLGSPQQRLFGALPKGSGISLANLGRNSSETVNLRASETSSLTESQSDVSVERESRCSEYSTTSATPSPGHVSYVTVIPNRVPPPTGFLATAKRTKEGYFIVSPKPEEIVESAKTGGSPKRKKGKMVGFVEKPGSLHRGLAMKTDSGRSGRDNAVQPPTTSYSTPDPSLTGSNQSAALHLHSNMKRSFRYRKITLRPEQPLFEDKGSDSEDEGEDKRECGSGDEGTTPVINGTALDISEEHVKKPGNTFAMSPVTTDMTFGPSDFNAGSSLIPRANRYSKVVIGGLRESCDDDTSRRRASSQPPSVRGNTGLSEQPFDTLPARPPSDCYVSRNSLDDILVEPPEMFNPTETQISPSSPNNKGVKEIVGRVMKGSSHMTARIIPSSVTHGNVSHDRHSTESNDTGYTSGASPGLAENQVMCVDIREFQLEFKDSSQTGSTSLEAVAKQPADEKPTNKITDGPRSYIPLVFYSIKRSFFILQVCLVEIVDELIKDLVSLKAIESFTLLECDELHGNDNVSACSDDFTVATSLEDLEFGFSVIRSTQKDLFSRKVRESTFEVQNLFGGSKPFSCDVMICHGDQMIVMPIEITL